MEDEQLFVDDEVRIGTSTLTPICCNCFRYWGWRGSGLCRATMTFVHGHLDCPRWEPRVERNALEMGEATESTDEEDLNACRNAILGGATEEDRRKAVSDMVFPWLDAVKGVVDATENLDLQRLYRKMELETLKLHNVLRRVVSDDESGNAG